MSGSVIRGRSGMWRCWRWRCVRVCGLSELLALRVGSVLGRPGERRVEVAGKGGRPRTVPIEPELDAVVERYLDSRRVRFGRAGAGSALLVDRRGAPLRRGGLQYLVESCYRRAGITDRVPRGAQLHALRHTFATRLAEDGANASEIMRLLGHASLTTSQKYIEVTAEQQRAAVRANRTNRALRESLGQAEGDVDVAAGGVGVGAHLVGGLEQLRAVASSTLGISASMVAVRPKPPWPSGGRCRRRR